MAFPWGNGVCFIGNRFVPVQDPGSSIAAHMERWFLSLFLSGNSILFSGQNNRERERIHILKVRKCIVCDVSTKWWWSSFSNQILPLHKRSRHFFTHDFAPTYLWGFAITKSISYMSTVLLLLSMLADTVSGSQIGLVVNKVDHPIWPTLNAFRA